MSKHSTKRTVEFGNVQWTENWFQGGYHTIVVSERGRIDEVSCVGGSEVFYNDPKAIREWAEALMEAAAYMEERQALWCACSLVGHPHGPELHAE